jgi:hypothetical protein
MEKIVAMRKRTDGYVDFLAYKIELGIMPDFLAKLSQCKCKMR